MSEALPPLFSPLQRAGQTIVMAPLTRRMAEADGTPTVETAADYARRARGGCGLIILQRMHGVSASATQSGDDLYEQSIRKIAGPWPKVTFGPARALRVGEIEEVVRGFADGAGRAVEAGFDGVDTLTHW